MVTVHFCDGCGNKIQGYTEAGNLVEIRVAVDPRSARSPDYKLNSQFDLCNGCKRSLFERCDPSKWPRGRVEDEAPEKGRILRKGKEPT